MREDPAQQSACQVPHVARPYPLYGVKLGKLRKGGVYAVGKPTEEGAFLGAGSLFLKEYGPEAPHLCPPTPAWSLANGSCGLRRSAQKFPRRVRGVRKARGRWPGPPRGE